MGEEWKFTFGHVIKEKLEYTSMEFREEVWASI
jgi:hypothetical protein